MSKNAALKNYYQHVVELYAQRFKSYEEQPESIPERKYRFSIRCYYDDPDKHPLLQTRASTGAENFLHRINLAEKLDPDEIEIIEMDEQGNPVEEGTARVRLRHMKPSIKQKLIDRGELPPETDPAEQEDNGSEQLGNPGPPMDESAQIAVLKKQHEMEMQAKDFEIKNLTKERDELKTDLESAEKDIEKLAGESQKGGFFDTITGVVKENPGILGSLLSGLQGTGQQGAPGQLSGSENGLLSNTTPDRAEMIAETAKLIKSLDEKQFENFFYVTSAISENPNAALEGFLQILEIENSAQNRNNGNEQQVNQQQYEQSRPDSNQNTGEGYEAPGAER